MKTMKKLCVCLAALCVLMLSACGGAWNVENLSDWNFQENSGTNDYSLLFGLSDKNGVELTAEVDVDIRIVNDNEETVYESTQTVTEDNFGYYSRMGGEERLLAEIRIPVEDIKTGSSTNGTVYFRVYKDDYLEFGECNTPAVYCLPVEKIKMQAEKLPQEVAVKDFMGRKTAVLRIDGVTCKTDDTLSGDSATVEITGQKLSGGGDSMYDRFDYKVYDSTGYMVDSGTVLLNALAVGDKFRDDSIMLYDLTPGESYTIKFATSD